MKNQQLLPSAMYKNYNCSKLVEREKKSQKEESSDHKESKAESKEFEPKKKFIDP